MLKLRNTVIAALGLAFTALVQAVIVPLFRKAVAAIYDTEVQDAWKDGAHPLIAHLWSGAATMLEWLNTFWGGALFTLAIIFVGEISAVFHRRRRGKLVTQPRFEADAASTEASSVAQPEAELPPTARPAADLMLLPPTRTYSLVWDAPQDMQIITTPDWHPTEPEQTTTRLPVFALKNLGSVVAKDVQIIWECDEINLPALQAAPRIASFYGRAQGQMFMLTSPLGETIREAGTAFLSQISSSFPYVAPQIDNYSAIAVDMPSQIYSCAELFFVAVLPDHQAFNAAEFSFRVTIRWKEDLGTAEAQFAVQAVPHSSRTGSLIVIDDKLRPDTLVKGTVKFAVTSLQEAALINP
ncbi:MULTISPECIES: hypothetical protein [unclassified Methylobacterium]|uniref:hypothetical protein n=1 Tax=unclassified Methylobacterium TaxID=2615210 RepID=UPI0011C20C2F|nr:MULTISPECIES: hypothetical protein [unclassified Methylobacterium]QEE38707.1 hypothetical protein FVA80_06685 [Methylobacterium sp. WL1]TXN57181.1 hypothetical protein FV241_12475 [Methylobacterium sp. WL2]